MLDNVISFSVFSILLSGMDQLHRSYTPFWRFYPETNQKKPQKLQSPAGDDLYLSSYSHLIHLLAHLRSFKIPGVLYLIFMKIPKKELKRIGIFRALHLGDILCSIPAIRNLRNAYPNAKIYFIGLPAAEPLIRRFSCYLDEFIPFPGYPGLPEQPFDEENFECFLNKIRNLNFDLILQMQGNGTIVNPMMRSFNARYLAGFCKNKEEENEFLLTYPNHGHEIHRHLSLIRHLGLPIDSDELEFPISSADYEHFAKLNLPLEPGNYVCIHPGSRGSWRQWPSLYFAGIGNYCTDLGYKVVLTGTSQELELIHHVAELMKTPPLVTAGRTTLGSLAVLISQAAALVANCTGVSHMAAALRTPSVIISMDTEPYRWGPLNKELHRTIDWTVTPDFLQVHKEVAALFV
jgi:ADP-heptose:LPS heptosyltransferase